MFLLSVDSEDEPVVDCVGSWNEWDACSEECGGGTQTRLYVVTTEASNGGTACCVEAGASESRSCNEAACPEGTYAAPGRSFCFMEFF
eukprot:SAG11_NODE_215_length_12235_cov_11.843276_9_plen_88_part_00